MNPNAKSVVHVAALVDDAARQAEALIELLRRNGDWEMLSSTEQLYLEHIKASLTDLRSQVEAEE